VALRSVFVKYTKYRCERSLICFEFSLSTFNHFQRWSKTDCTVVFGQPKRTSYSPPPDLTCMGCALAGQDLNFVNWRHIKIHHSYQSKKESCCSQYVFLSSPGMFIYKLHELILSQSAHRPLLSKKSGQKWLKVDKRD